MFRYHNKNNTQTPQTSDYIHPFDKSTTDVVSATSQIHPPRENSHSSDKCGSREARVTPSVLETDKHKLKKTPHTRVNAHESSLVCPSFGTQSHWKTIAHKLTIILGSSPLLTGIGWSHKGQTGTVTFY